MIKKASSDLIKELNSIKFDSSYLNVAVDKYVGKAYKLFGLKAYEANILKQLCLSLGFDCAVSRDTVTCKCDFTDAVLFASNSQIKKLIKKLRVQPFRLKKLSDSFSDVIKQEISPLKIRNFVFDWTKPYIMGVVNATPDSFSDGGSYNPIEQALKLIEDGADIIDVGGESTRPDANSVSIEEEISRILPVIQAIRENNKDIVISVDTRNYLTAKSAIETGADIINDVSGLEYDDKLFDYVVKRNLPVVIMHSDKVPAVSVDFSNSDVVEEVYFSLKQKIDKLTLAGLDKKNIIADIGIGFGKSKNSNFELIRRIDEFSTLGTSLLLGISRKSFIRNQFNINCDESDVPTALYSAMLSNINIHRVHNVKLTKKYLDYASLLRG